MSSVEKKSSDFFKSLQLDTNCPIRNPDFTRSIHEFSDEIKHKRINLATIQEVQIYYKILTSSSTLDINELRAKIDNFKEKYQEAKKLSVAQNKKLLIAVGETHVTNESLFFEILIALFLKQEGITRLLTETSSSELKRLQQNYKKTERFLSTSFCHKVLDMDVVAIDPLNKDKDSESKVHLRNQKINEAIVINDDSDALAVVGESHLTHIVPSKEIQDRFVILPVSVGHDVSYVAKSMYGKKLLHEMSPALDHNYDLVDMQLSKSVESFSINRLIEIAHSVDSTEHDNQIYKSDFSDNTGMCKGFDISHQVVSMTSLLYDKHSGDL